LHKALREYRTQQCRYETAQVYEWMAKAHVALGEHQAADADTATAESIYRQLRVEPARKPATPSPGGLTKREVDILTRIVGGATNKQVAEQVFLAKTMSATANISPSSASRRGRPPCRGPTPIGWSIPRRPPTASGKDFYII
jgi:hypothetical protein